MTTDHPARERALDTASSFIVRAPAGSGKTGLLTQRVLALLASVDEPEQIVAMTFTRKAAAEMKQRLLKALTGAASDLPPEDAFEARTRELAHAALQRDAVRGWSLTDNPARLRVQTIDSFAQSLARQLPVTLGLGAALRVNEEPEPLYTAAARATLAALEDESDSTAIDAATLLRHLDNDIGRAEALLAAMLAKRDQWLRHATQLDRATLEAALKRETERALHDLCARLPPEHCDELVALARYAAGNVDELHALARCRELAALPDQQCDALPAWRALAEMMLVKNKNRFRKRFNIAGGFPPEKADASFTRKERVEALALTLAETRDLADSLHAIRLLPEPRYTDAQWEALGAITRLLVRATGELKVIFAARGEVDFAEVTIAAAQALGTAAAPTDLAFALDARLTHLLVDEFQDTSISQFVLIERLAADWTAGDGRTLFVVGDPMQSIYRFRDAEVGLFVRAWNDGIGPVPLQPLQLRRNFRSQPALVEWVNNSFAQLLPGTSDIAVGAIAFESAEAVRTAHPGDAVTVHALADESALSEAQRVVALVHTLRAREPGTSIAILFRARNDLIEIVPALRAAQLPYTAVELDVLDARPMVRDLLALTRALDHLGDRVAWLAVLRAPWCGLTLADLSALIERNDTRATVWSLIAASDHAERLGQLSAEGRARVGNVRDVMQRALELDGRASLRCRVEHAWWLLGGPACVEDQAALSDAERYFERLAAHEQETAGALDLAQFERSLRKLYAAADAEADSNLALMTIYKAKGLEFDYVIVPGLARRPRSNRADLLRWLELPLASGGDLLVAPINATGKVADDSNDVYRWIQRLSDIRHTHEIDRLLYVAATRARRQLHWITCVASKDGAMRPAVRGSLLSRLESVLASDLRAAVENDAAGVRPLEKSGAPAFDQSLRRLPLEWRPPAPLPSVSWLPRDDAIGANDSVEFSWAGESARRVGIVVHRWLQTMADDELRGWDRARVEGMAPLIERELAAGGLAGDELAAARQRALAALANALTDQRARWLLGAQAEAKNEWRLTVRDARGVRRMIVDRAFRDADGRQWIVDYKTSAHEGADVEGFLDRERLRYAGQLQSYAQALGGADQLGLYFPLLKGWRAWASEDES